jgi:predicted RNase H-like HicB family nuclease
MPWPRFFGLSRCLCYRRSVNCKGTVVTRYSFEVVVEPDEDAWYAYCPALVEQGGATWGASREEALANLDDVIRMVVASMIEHGESIPEEPADRGRRSEEQPVDVTV